MDQSKEKKIQTEYVYRDNKMVNGLMGQQYRPPEDLLRYVHTIDL